MSEIMKKLALISGLDEDGVIEALGTLAGMANRTLEEWEKEGARYLLDTGLITTPRDGREPVEFGELGVIIKRLHEKTGN
jgi:hypothetical protein